MASDTALFNSRDHKEFLQKVIASKKAERRHIGVRSISRNAGFASPATLSMILNGKRNLTQNVAEKLAHALKLSSREKKYLYALMYKSNAASELEKRTAEELLIKLRNGKDLQGLEWKQFQFLSVWYYPVIYVMVGQKSFRRDLFWIAKRLGRGVRVDEVETAIDDMISLGLVCEENGQLKQALGAIDTGKEVSNLSTYKYLRKMIELAFSAVDMPAEKREMSGLTFSVPAERLPEVKERMRQFRRDLNEYFSQFSDGEMVYQLNMQFFPLCEDIAP